MDVRFPWRHGQASDRIAQSAVSTAGMLYVEEDTGHVAIGDGITQIGALARVLHINELSTTISTAIAAAVINANTIALPAESGFSGAWVDSAGHIALGMKNDGTVVPYKIQLPSAVTALMMQSQPAESGYVWTLSDPSSRFAIGVTSDGSVYMPKQIFAAGSVSLAALATSIQQAIPLPATTESGWAWTVGDSAGRVSFGVLPDGSPAVAKAPRSPWDYTRTTLDSTSYTVVGDFDKVNLTHRLRIFRKSDGRMFRVGAVTSNAIDPRISADGTLLLFRTDAPITLLDRPTLNSPYGKPVTFSWRSVSVPLDGSSNVLTPVLSTALFVGLGDSLTQGTGGSGGGYLPYLETLSGLPGYNAGLGGQTSPQISARFNSPSPTVTVTGNSIPTSGPVALTALSVSIGYYSGDLARSEPGTLAGVHGVLTYAGGAAGDAASYTFTADAGLSSAVTCPPGTAFVTDFGETYKGCRIISWQGRNNLNNPSTQLSPMPENDTAACVAHMTPLAKQFIVLSVLTGGGEGVSNATTYGRVKTINDNLAAAYPGRYIDIRKGLISGGVLWTGGPSLPSALTYLGLTPTTGAVSDTTDIADDTVPAQIRFDQVHLLDPGYQYVAYVLNQFFIWKGWA